VDGWAEKDPAADIVFVAGLCKPRYSKEKGVIIADCDDQEVINAAEDIFGDTPGKVGTRQGQHRYFAANGVDLGKLHSLRHFGLNIDLKHGQSQAAIIASPPSVHEKEPSFRYYWDDCSPEILSDLPPFPEKRLRDWMDRFSPSNPLNKEARNGSRHLSLNDYLAGKGGRYFPDDWDGFLDEGFTWNVNVPDRFGKEPLPDEDVVKVAKAVWKDFENGKLVPMHGSGGVARTDRDELATLFTTSTRHAPDALALLCVLKVEHSSKCARGETFAITPRSMAEANTIPGWSVERYEKARDVLVEAGLIIKVSEFKLVRGLRYAAQYILPPRRAGGQSSYIRGQITPWNKGKSHLH
jgi:hypothetical protein